MSKFNFLQSTVFRIAIAATAILAAVAAIIIHLVAGNMNASLTRSTESQIQTDVLDLKSEYRSGGMSALAAAIDEKVRIDGSGLYLLFDATGTKRAGNLPVWPTNLQGGTSAGVFTYFSSAATTNRSAAGVLIILDDGARLAIARDVEGQRLILAQLRLNLALGIGVLIFLGLLGSQIIARLLLKRIGAMSLASEAFMAGNLSGRIPVSGHGDEFDGLAIQLNGMLARIEQLVGGLREVSDNIAHDLKTPLNRLRNAAEAALADPRGGASWREGLQSTIEQADDLMKTFNALLLIARLEAGAVEESFEPFDLVEVCAGIAELYEPAAEDQGLSISVVATAAHHVLANRHLVGQAIANLLDNAIKYGADPNQNADVIEITVTRNGQFADLAVADHGPGISKEDRARSVKRFVRLDQSRTKPGTGLGLSLVAAVAQLHRGIVRLEDNAPGLRVVLSIPLATSSDVVRPLQPLQNTSVGSQ